jgi:DNA polymerase-1
MDENSHLVLVDGSAYIFRAYHALPPLTRKSDGTPVGAVAGFCNMLWKLTEDTRDEDHATHFAVIFDAKGKTFRNEIYDQYKAHRPPAPEDLVPQFPLVRDATRAFGLPAIEEQGFEADDLIATYAAEAEKRGASVTIISSDKDLMQLVTDKTDMLDPMKNLRIRAEEVRDKFGVGPERVVDVQALAGDSADNVPGVPGIGVKTAALLVEEFGDLEGILANAHTIKQNKRRENLIEFADLARVSMELVTLRKDTPMPEPLDDLGCCDTEGEVLLSFLSEMEFSTLSRRVQAALDLPADPTDFEDTSTPVISDEHYACVTDLETLQTWIAKASKAGVVAVDTETDALSSTHAKLVGISLSHKAGHACYIPVGHTGAGDLMSVAPDQLDLRAVIKALTPLLTDPHVLKIGQNFKYDLGVLHRYGVDVTPFDDTMLLSYALDGGKVRHGMDAMSERYLGHNPIPFKQVCGVGKSQISFAQVDLEPATKYAAEDADITFRLWQILKPRIAREQMVTVYETLERPLPQILSTMELAGIKVNRAELSRLSLKFAQKMAEFEDAAKELARHPFNLASPRQLGEILFDEMALPGGKKTKTGAWKTDAKVLDDLAADGHELPKTILNWRQLQKLKSTYTDALGKAADPETSRVHTSFMLAATTTGRLASSDPNLMNIPIRTEEGRKIRAAFVPEPGKVLLSADYSQIELRVLAHIADVPDLRQAFADGLDIHAMTASEMFGVPMEGMDPHIRRQAKAINFGIIYGISAFGLANQLGISRTEAGAYIKAYFEKFPGIKDYMEAAKAQARENGYVTTLFGRKCWCQQINDKNPMSRSFAERQAINAPIQGSAADIMRRAMIRMPGALAKANLGASMLLQVHDELVFEVPETKADELAALAGKIMENACAPVLELSVPLVVDSGAGPNWEVAH